MSTTSSKEEILAKTLLKLLKILNIEEVPVALIKQIEYRIGSKPNSVASRRFSTALGKIVTPAKDEYDISEKIIPFNVQNEGGDIPLKESYSFNGHMRQCSEDIKDLFSAVECLHLILTGATCRNNLTSPAEFQFLHKMVQDYLDVCAKGELNGKPFNTNDSVVNFYKNVCTAAQRQILGKDSKVNKENLLKYQKYLAVQEAESPFLPLGNRKDLADAIILLEVPYIAEEAIKIIMNYGFNYEDSVAIYNRRFGCKYIPFVGVSVVCAVCHRVTRSKNDKPADVCVHCKEALFRKCSKEGCGVTILRTTDACPQCGTRESDLAQFANLIVSAKSLVAKDSIEQAELCVATAQSLAPDRKAEINDLQKTIDHAKRERDSIIQDIEDSIGKRIFFDAAKKLAVAKRKVPSTLLSNAEIRIVNAQNNADKIFTTANCTTEELQKVLAVCADHPGALDRISKIPPKAPSELVISESDGYIQLSWNASSEIGVKYRVVRKLNNPPKTALDVDDKDVIETTEKLFARDSSPVPGKVYYAVFSERGGKYSTDSASKSVVFLPPVSETSYRQLSDRVEISYKIPRGASGVRIDRKSNGNISNLYTGTQPIAVDRSVPEQCSYIITALYENRESKEKIIPFTATTLPKKFEPHIHVDQNKVFISWKTAQKGFKIKVCKITQSHFTPSVDMIYVDSELVGKTLELASVSCEETSVSFTVKPNSEYKLVVLIGNSNGWLCCGVFPIYAGVYPKLKHAPHSVGLRGEHFFTFEDSLPSDVREILYAVSKENTIPNPKEFKQGSLIGYTGIEGAAVRVQNIGQPLVGQGHIFCQFLLNDGRRTSLMCSKVHFRQDIQVQVNLKIKGINVKGDIRFRLNKYDYLNYSELPELRLNIGSEVFPISRCPVIHSKPDYVSLIDLQLSTPLNNVTEIKLVPVDSVFNNDFTIDYKL